MVKKGDLVVVVSDVQSDTDTVRSVQARHIT